MSAFITASSSFMPNSPIHNNEIEDVLGLINEKPSRVKNIILRNNGIKIRHYAIDPKTKEPNFNNAQLTAEAIRGLFDNEKQLNEIDLIATGTTMPDQLAPSHSVMVHGELKNNPCETVSMSGICLSGLMALKYCFLAVKNNDSKKAVASGSEIVSALLHAKFFNDNTLLSSNQLKTNPELAFDKDFLRWMLSDGAGALCIEPKPKENSINLEINWIKTYSYANELETCMYLGAKKLNNSELSGWLNYNSKELSDKNIFALTQDVKLLNNNIINYAIEKTLDRIIIDTGIKATDIDYFLPHASSMFFIPKIKKALDDKDFCIPMDKWFTNLETKGNTGSASIFIMLDEFIKTKDLRRGDKILCFVPESGRFSSGFMLLTAS
ncbi:MAG TPA: StlD/DarB family beta-ketosynthase [Piscirickettsiaceae bacterium]|nr:StlD/DarB family beta-ketosynthase [Piscirickettsiaceae bacterium]